MKTTSIMRQPHKGGPQKKKIIPKLGQTKKEGDLKKEQNIKSENDPKMMAYCRNPNQTYPQRLG